MTSSERLRRLAMAGAAAAVLASAACAAADDGEGAAEPTPSESAPAPAATEEAGLAAATVEVATGFPTADVAILYGDHESTVSALDLGTGEETVIVSLSALDARIAEGGIRSDSITLSPGLTHLAFVVDGELGDDLYLLDLATGTAAKALDGPVDLSCGRPEWSPDGGSLAVPIDPTGSGAVAVVAADGATSATVAFPPHCSMHWTDGGMWVGSEAEGALRRIDTATGAVVHTLDLEGMPEGTPSVHFIEGAGERACVAVTETGVNAVADLSRGDLSVLSEGAAEQWIPAEHCLAVTDEGYVSTGMESQSVEFYTDAGVQAGIVQSSNASGAYLIELHVA